MRRCCGWLLLMVLFSTIFSIRQMQAQIDRIVIAAGTDEDHALQAISSEQDAQNLLGRPIVLKRQQEFDRALANVARAPRAAGILLEAVRRGQMDHGVVREPGEDRVDGKRVR